ncbi:MAG: CHRD domain-containing protein [Phycisphaerales bacterium]|nr:CHRD domain-containing protein [Phycisphaerales bacterium]
MRLSTITLAVAITISQAASADVADIGPSKDNTLYEDPAGGLSNGSGFGFFAGKTFQDPSADVKRGLIAFDVAVAVPPGSVINNVTLTLHMSKTIAGSELVSLHRALADWGEGTSVASGGGGAGGAATVGDATWLHTFFDTDFWANPGGDFEPTPSATVDVGNVGFYTWTSTPQMVADVQSWLDDPANNFGWMLIGNEINAPTAKRFDTKENPSVTVRPRLTIDFTPLAPGVCSCKGDSNADGNVDGDDIQGFINCVLGPGVPTGRCACNDIDGDCDVDTDDIPMFVDSLLTGQANCSEIVAACCLGDGSCVNTIACYCANQLSGVFMPGQNCLGAICPPDVGVCCFGNTCLDGFTETECQAICGVWQGMDTTCISPIPLCTPTTETGACCLNEECFANLEQSFCECIGGDYQGPGTNCFSLVCAPIGACCFGLSNGCTESTEVNCLSACGEWLGAGTVCGGADVCPATPEGACCFGGQCVDDFTQAACECSIGGTWHGAGSACGDGVNDVNCFVGRCCLPDGTCVELEFNDCFNQCGVFQQPGAFCNDITRFTMFMDAAQATDSHNPVPPAPPPSGNGNGAFRFNTTTNELAFHIQHNGLISAETVAHIHGPAPPGIGAPIVYTLPLGKIKDGVITLTDPGSYPVPDQINDLFNGLWYVNIHSENHPTGEIRGQILPFILPCEPLPTGACCFEEPGVGQMCVENTECECALELSSVYFGDGTTCTNETCDSGACCLPDGSCALLLESDCLSQCGSFQGVLVTCAETTCVSPATGACCIEQPGQEPLCVENTQCECELLLSGTYQGDNTDCTTGCPLPTGPCCFGDPCNPVTTEAACQSLCGTWLGPGATCGECPVVPTGACCFLLPGIPCFDGVTREFCECTPFGFVAAVGGTYQGDGTTCGDVDCNLGRCCLPNGDCVNATSGSCAEVCGFFQWPGTSCEDNEVVLGMLMNSMQAASTHAPPPAPPPSGTGTGSFRLDTINNELRINIQFTGLSGPVTVAHIHGPAEPGMDAPIVYNIVPPDSPIATTIPLVDPGGYPVAQQIDDLVNELWYVNIHTVNHPVGEIRGQIIPLTPPCETVEFATGACCISGAPNFCEILTQCECDSLGGFYFGDESLCDDPQLCQRGACCQPDGMCFNTTEEDCQGPCDVFQGALNRCDEVDCTPVTGACCVGSTCTVNSECACEVLLSGEYQGDGTDCLPNPCVPQPTSLQLAGNVLTGYPHFEYVSAFNFDGPVHVAIDPTRFPAIVGMTCDVYMVAAKDDAQWEADRSLTDVRVGGPQTVTFNGSDIQSNTLMLTAPSEFNGDAGTGLGVGYDVVCDCNQDGFLDSGDFADGFSDEPGFHIVHDLTQLGPLPVVSDNYMVDNITAPGQNFERTWYPADIATMGQLPLIVISHGNGQQYTFYDYLQEHLASYGYIVMAHRTNSVAGPDSAAETTLEHTDAIIDQQAMILNGDLNGHIDETRIVWIGQGRGGEGVVRAYDELVTGGFTPQHYDQNDIALISTIAPTDNDLGTMGMPDLANPSAVAYHLIYGAADGIVDGCADHDELMPFNIFDRATGFRQATYVHAAWHNAFNCCGFFDYDGPGGGELDRADVQTIAKGVYLALIQRYLEGNVPAKDYLWRQHESLPVVGDPTAVVDRLYHDATSSGNFVIDDYQDLNFDPNVSSSGGLVNFDAGLGNVLETLLNDEVSGFTWLSSDPQNGMVMCGDEDDSAGVVFDWTVGMDHFYEFEIIASERDFSDNAYLSLRACQGTQHPETIAEIGDLTFTVTLLDGSGGSSSINIGEYGGGIEEPYARVGTGFAACGPNPGWANEFETVRIRLTDFLTNGSGLDLTDVVTVRLEFGSSFGSSRGRLGLDSVEVTNE